MRALRLALGLFTIVPAGSVGTPERRTVRAAVLLAPLFGLLIGGLGAVVLFAAREATQLRNSWGPGFVPLSALLAAAGAITTIQLLTGALHLDGFADTVDGLAARGDAERTLAVMRDSAAGATAAAAIALLLLVDTAALALAVIKGHGTQALVTATVAGRVAVVWGCAYRPARPDGLGAWVGRTTTWRSASVVTVLAMLVPVALAVADDDPTRPMLPFAVAAIPLAVGLAHLLLRPIISRIGGVTGDVLGASLELTTAITLLIMALA